MECHLHACVTMTMRVDDHVHGGVCVRVIIIIAAEVVRVILLIEPALLCTYLLVDMLRVS